MNVVDSSGWLEYFADGPNADFFAAPIEDTGHLVVPTISIYEVFKRVFHQRGERAALQAVSVMMQGTVVELDARLAMSAARLSLELGLPMAIASSWRQPGPMEPPCRRRMQISKTWKMSVMWKGKREAHRHE